MPVVLAVIGVVVGVVSAVVGGVTAANARNDAKRAAAKAANAQLAQIAKEEEAALFDEVRRSRKLAGVQRAAFGASGIELTGSPLSVLLETEGNLQIGLARIQEGFDAQRVNVRAGLQRTNVAIRAEGTAATGQLIGSLGSTLLTGGEFFANRITTDVNTTIPGATPISIPATPTPAPTNTPLIVT